MIFRSWECLMIIECMSVMIAVQSMSDELPPPRNLSYVWADEFHVKITWEKPEDLSSCQVEDALQYGVNVIVGVKPTKSVRWRDMFYDCIITTEEMGPIGAHYTIETLCGNKRRSKLLNQTIYPPAPNIELVKDFECYLYSTYRMNCSWIAANQVPDLRVFYRVCNLHRDTTFSVCEYSNMGMKTCYLRVDQIDEEICILLNGTLDGASVRNTFKLKPREKVKPPPPKVTIKEHGKDLVFSWTTPNIVEDKENHAKCWKYIVNYTKCNVPLLEPLQVHESVVAVIYNEDCRYEVQVKSEFEEFCGKGGSDISDVETHGVNKTPDSSMIVAVIIIPTVLSACVILVCYCFRKHRAMIFPIIPDPSMIFKEMMMGSSYEPKSALGNLYIPAQEDVELCKINLVTEDQRSQPDT